MQRDSSPSGTASAADTRRAGGLLLVLSGPSGVGKTTVTNALKAEGWPGYVVVTATTRRPREGEVDGMHYLFRTVQQFQEMVRNGELLEHAEVHGNYYGVPAAPVREQLARGRDVILTIDPQGAATIRKRTRNAIFIFLAPESVDDLVERVELRGQDTPEQRALRLLNAEREMAELPGYDYAIVNRSGCLAEAVALFKAIVQAEHSRVQPRAAEV
ncbi:MAG TPA: guanylate kinase [Ktedonobacterales bacterium]